MYWLLRNKVLLLLFFSAVGPIKAQKYDFAVDSTNAKIAFTIKHLGVLTVAGKFTSFDGSLQFENNKLLAVYCTVEAGSIDTDDASRDKTLQSDTYFDVVNHPFISFSSTAITDASVDGLLTIKGVQRPIRLTYNNINNESQSSILALAATIRREDFALDFGSMNALIGDKVNIKITIDL